MIIYFLILIILIALVIRAMINSETKEPSHGILLAILWLILIASLSAL